MIFKFNELEESIKKNFVFFHKEMRFSSEQIYSAIMDEYIWGEDFTNTEEICIHIFLVLNYSENNLNYANVLENLKNKMSLMSLEDIKRELEDEYDEFIKEYNYVIGLE